ncbi:MAG: retropepsin-like aspartic protease [Candidatus Omnitrophica bacterium]|nr:retropepsin-like aspartic protease [Candidatus Omnitrophota bacterium]MDD5081254.1 retropepsin-like aspartic protease [Candidatus Omnitrophota bacterium]MDD5441554.1 retropepsin-like aspartic protease [Candidatus Omnitrophota bacterium]
MDFFKYILAVLLISGCSACRGVKNVAVFTGKTVAGTTKLTAKTVSAVSKGAVKTGKVIVSIPAGTTEVPLIRKGNTYMVKALLNGKVEVLFILDTGADQTLISRRLAKKIGISSGIRKQYRIAGGKIVNGIMAHIRQIKVGRAKIKNVETAILDNENMQGYDGLLGMSFLNNFNFRIDTRKNILYLTKNND